MRTLVVSDIHGNYDQLIRALEYSEYRDSDRLVCLGDYIDYGPDSRKVVELLLDLRKNKDNVILIGNHEWWMLDMLAGHSGVVYTWFHGGGGFPTLKNYGINPDWIHARGVHMHYIIREHRRFVRDMVLTNQELTEFIGMVFPREHLEFFASLPDRYIIGDFFFSHAGVESGIKLKDTTALGTIHGDDAFLNGSDKRDYGKTIVHGHRHYGLEVGFKKICVAAEHGRVGVLNLDDLSWVDSDGNTDEMDPRDLLGPSYDSYAPMPRF